MKKGSKMSKEARQKMSIAKKGKPSWNKGKAWSKKAKEKLSFAHRNSSKCKKWLRKLHKKSRGKHHSPETEFKKGLTPWNKNKKPSQFSGKNACNWRGGRTRKSDGYISIYNPNHPFANKNKYVLEHRLVMERKLKRYLKPFEGIHHKNGIRDDNRLKNLILFTSNKNWHSKNCPKCGFRFLIK